MGDHNRKLLSADLIDIIIEHYRTLLLADIIETYYGRTQQEIIISIGRHNRKILL